MKMEFTYRFEAAHRFLNSDSVPCMTPHGHTWYATMSLRYTGGSLNSSQMGVEFTTAKKGFRELIQQTFDHSYLHNLNDPLIPVLKESHPACRLIPFPGDPTTEMVALLLFHKMTVVLESQDNKLPVEVDAIRVQETPTNQIVCDRAFYLREAPSLSHYAEAWWLSPEISDRRQPVKK